MIGLQVTTTAPHPPALPEEMLSSSKMEKLVKQRSGPVIVQLICWMAAMGEAIVILASNTPELKVSRNILLALAIDGTEERIKASPLFVLGTFLTALGGFIRHRCYRELGRLFTFEMSLRTDHKLVTTGPYSVVRHPGYSGVVLCVLGIIIWHAGSGSWARECGALKTTLGQGIAMIYLILVTTITFGLLIRMYKEDEALSEAFGEEWLHGATFFGCPPILRRKNLYYDIPSSPICSRDVFAQVINEHIDSGCEDHLDLSLPQSSSSLSVPPRTVVKTNQKKMDGSSSSPIAPIFTQDHKKTSSKSNSSPFTNTPTNKRAVVEDMATRPPLKRNKLAHLEAAAPLAEKLRPSICGKTTLARLIAKQADCIFKELSATNVGVTDVRATLEEAKNTLALTGRVFVLERLTDVEIMTVLVNALKRIEPISVDPRSTESEPSSSEPPPLSPSDATVVSRTSFPQMTSKILSGITSLAAGDARTAISLLELAIKMPRDIKEESLLAALKRSVSVSYDRTGESHYDMISALHKSVRGSQGSAAMYWLARMLTAGEDPLYIARRMVVCASEDIGLADNRALPMAMATLQACQTIGMPECRINLAHLVAYLAEAPKSTRAYEAYNRAEAAAKLDLTIPVPMSMRNAPTELMKDLGYGKTYMYNPSYAHPVHNTYLPIQFEGEVFLRREGDMRDKIWDEAALRVWEHEANGDKEWEGRPAVSGPQALATIPMPTIPRDSPEDGTFRVLVTGFGPFHHYEVNPSWLAVQFLHDTTLSPDPATAGIRGRPIHISALEIPVSYEAVLAVVPGLHARPPILPRTVKDIFPPPPPSGYDFIFHIGVAGRGPLRMERQGHKLGYHMKDADGKLAPLARSTPKDFSRRPDDRLTVENIERERLGLEMVEHIGSDTSARPTRGFGVQYESFPDELPTEIDVTRLVQDLKQSGIEQIYTSMDAGHYLCDFIYFCSLAEAKRTANPYERRRNSQVLFLHCPPVNQPLSTEEVTEAIQRIIVWVCKEMQIQDEENANADSLRLQGK
ncbi:hypothetical protein C0995_002133 [Termitomyces sp. Mi166|nr:hypothetical protein C0995_002133 [Termitomyces sp. Mi166\